MSKYNQDELEAPAFVDKSFFEDVFQTYKNDKKLKIKEFKITPGTAPGDHFASIMFKVSVTSKDSKGVKNDTKIIMKLLPVVDGFKKEVFKDTPSFKNEIRMYTKVLPEMERALAGVGIEVKFAPPLIYCNMSKYPSPVIVFKDVSTDGFGCQEFGRIRFESTRVAALTFSKFHAASLYLNANGTKLDDFDEHHFKPDPPERSASVFFKASFVDAVQKLKEWDGCAELGEIIEKYTDQYLDGFDKVWYAKDKAQYCILNHGDVHGKNMMFRNEGVKQEDFYLIDFQFPMWGSPALDIYALLNNVASVEVKQTHRYEIMRLYFDDFIETLKKLGYTGKLPTFLDLQIDLLRFSVMDVVHVIGFSPFCFMNFSEIDFEGMQDDPSKVIASVSKSIYERQDFKDYLVENLKRLKIQGSLEQFECDIIETKL